MSLPKFGESGCQSKSIRELNRANESSSTLDPFNRSLVRLARVLSEDWQCLKRCSRSDSIFSCCVAISFRQVDLHQVRPYPRGVPAGQERAAGSNGHFACDGTKRMNASQHSNRSESGPVSLERYSVRSRPVRVSESTIHANRKLSRNKHNRVWNVVSANIPVLYRSP